MYLEKTNSNRMIRLLVCVMCVFAITAMLHTAPAFAISATSFSNAKITNVTTASVDYKTIQVSWKKLKGSSGYEVWVADKKAGKYKKAGVANGVSRVSLNIGKRVTGQKYFFKVRAFTTSGGSYVYSKFSAAKAGKATLNRPELTLSVLTKTKVKVSYTKVTGATGYEIRRSTKQTGTYKKVKIISSGKTLKYTDKNAVMVKNQCFYKVRAFRKSGGKKLNGPYSAVVIGYEGNAKKYDLSKITAGTGLADLDVVFLGSSVTLGKYSEEQSFVDALMKKDGISGGLSMKAKRKFAVNGTTLVNSGATSYVSRLTGQVSDTITSADDIDYLVCQLSTNDAKSKSLSDVGTTIRGPVSDLSRYDTATVIGAIEYIIGYTANNFDCPTIFYVVPEFESTLFDEDHYQKMIRALHNVKAKWDGHDKDAQGNVMNEAGDQVLILDMWTDPTYNVFVPKASDTDRNLWLADAVHPTKAGYVHKYTPAFEALLDQMRSLSAQEDMQAAEDTVGLPYYEAAPQTDPYELQQDLPEDGQEDLQENGQEEVQQDGQEVLQEEVPEENVDESSAGGTDLLDWAAGF